MTEKGNITVGVEHLPPKQKRSIESTVLIGFTALLFGMTLLANLNLFGDDGVTGVFKAVIIAASATLVSYAVNRFALEKGAELTATGFISAGFVSVASILIVGLGLYGSTYGGLVRGSVDALRLQDHGRALSQFVARRSRAAAEAGRMESIVAANNAELQRYLACERRESCLSGRGNGGRGSVTRKLEELSGRSRAIAARLKAGERARKSSLDDLNKLLAAYHETVSGSNKWFGSSRAALLKIDGQIRQAVSALDEAVPLALLKAYAGELRKGVVIAGRDVAATRINRILGKQADGLDSVLETISTGHASPPPFPPQAGVDTAFTYMGHFLPIAILVACVELVFPIALWVYTLQAIIWRKHQSALELQAAASKAKTRRNTHDHDRTHKWDNRRSPGLRKNKPNGRDRDVR